MKLTVRCYDYEFEIQTTTIVTHSLLSDNPELQEKIKTAVALEIHKHVAPEDTSTT